MEVVGRLVGIIGAVEAVVPALAHIGVYSFLNALREQGGNEISECHDSLAFVKSRCAVGIEA